MTQITENLRYNSTRMRGSSIPERLSEAVVQFCQENFVYNNHLLIEGSVTIIVDEESPVVSTIKQKLQAFGRPAKHVKGKDEDIC